MAKKLDQATAAAMRKEARALEKKADSPLPYAPGTAVSRPNAPSRMFNVRLSDEQFQQLQRVAEDKHLPMSTMARAWLLDRLASERQAS